jgi:hypothetical protein
MAREVAEEECLRVSSDPNEFLRMIGEKPMEDEGMKPVERNGMMAGKR